jgi:hypothetical protein
MLYRPEIRVNPRRQGVMKYRIEKPLLKSLSAEQGTQFDAQWIRR